MNNKQLAMIGFMLVVSSSAVTTQIWEVRTGIHSIWFPICYAIPYYTMAFVYFKSRTRLP